MPDRPVCVYSPPKSARNRFWCGPPGPDPIYRNTQEHDQQTWPRGLRLVQDQYDHDGERDDDIQGVHEGIAKRAVWTLGLRAFGTQQKYSGNREHIKDQYGEDNVIKQIAI